MGETAKIFVPVPGKDSPRVKPGREFDVPEDTLVWLGEGNDRVAVGHVLHAEGAADGDAIIYTIEINDDVVMLLNASLGDISIDGPPPTDG